MGTITNNLKPRFNYRKLRGKIKEVYGTEGAFASALGIKQSTVSQKLTNKTLFTNGEIAEAIALLNLSAEETMACFFCVED